MELGAHSKKSIEEARKLFAGPCDFMLGVVGMEHLPPPNLPEVAFSGRSNVGKSSLLNALANRNSLARTSNTPGRTRELNFFNLGDKVRLVDLPGYGYARASRTEVDSWTNLIHDYLRGRVNLRRVFLLIDSRHGFKPVDQEIMSILDEAAVPYEIVPTKIDKIKPTALPYLIDDITAALKKHPAAFPLIRPTSSDKGTGLPDLRADIFQISVDG
ncbi:MAG: ribosome biogenesis GTP-binding protein YihA/YsxC [Parvularculaceae bacterium]